MPYIRSFLLFHLSNFGPHCFVLSLEPKQFYFHYNWLGLLIFPIQFDDHYFIFSECSVRCVFISMLCSSPHFQHTHTVSVCTHIECYYSLNLRQKYLPCIFVFCRSFCKNKQAHSFQRHTSNRIE